MLGQVSLCRLLTVACQLLSGDSPGENTGVGSAPPRDQTGVSCVGQQVLYHRTPWEAHHSLGFFQKLHLFSPSGQRLESKKTPIIWPERLPKDPLPSFVHPSFTHPHQSLTPPHFEQVPGFQLSVHLVHVHPLLWEPWAPQWCLRPTERHLLCAHASFRSELMVGEWTGWGCRANTYEGSFLPASFIDRDAVLTRCTLFLRMGHRGFVCARKCQKCPTENTPLSVTGGEEAEEA